MGRTVFQDSFDRTDEATSLTSNGWGATNVRLVSGVVTSYLPSSSVAIQNGTVPVSGDQYIRALVASALEGGDKYVAIAGRLVGATTRSNGYRLSLFYNTGGSRTLSIEKYDSNFPGVLRTLVSSPVTLVQQAGTDLNVSQDLVLNISDVIGGDGVSIKGYVNNPNPNAPNISFLDLGQSSVTQGSVETSPPSGGSPSSNFAIPISVWNYSSFPRTPWDVACCGVKFNQGEVQDSNVALGVTGGRSGGVDRVQWYPQGALWPDGSVKYARLHFPVAISSAGPVEKPVTILGGISTFDPHVFTPRPELTTGLSAMQFVFHIKEAGQTAVDHVVNISSGFLPVDLPNRADDWVRRYRCFSRLGGRYAKFYVEIVIDTYSDVNHAQLWFTFGDSYAVTGRADPGSTDPLAIMGTTLETTINGALPEDHIVSLSVYGPECFLREENKKVVGVPVRQLNPTGGFATRINLIDPTVLDCAKFRQGMSHAYEGTLIFEFSGNEANWLPSSRAEKEDDTYAEATDWWAKGMPSFDVVLGYPPYIVSAGGDLQQRASAIARIDTYAAGFLNGGLDHDPYGTSGMFGPPDDGSPGDHGVSFGVMKEWLSMRAGYPRLQRVIKRESRQKAIWPNWFVKPDGSMWTYDEFPDVAMYDGLLQNYPSGATISDLLGVKDLTTGGSQSDTPRTWIGPNIQHWSIHHDVWCAVSSMDYFMLKLMNNLAEVYKAMAETSKFPGLISSWGSERGMGRTYFHVPTELYEITGKSGVETAVMNRVNVLENLVDPANDLRYWGRTPNNAPTNFIALREELPGTQSLNLQTVNHAFTWQSTVAVNGLWAIYHNNQTDPLGLVARRIAGEVAGTLVQYGILDLRTTYQFLHISAIAGGFISRATVNGLTVTATTSGATGVVHYAKEREPGLWELHMHSCTGQFVQGADTLAIGGSITAHQDFRYYPYAVAQTMATNGHAPLSDPQIQASYVDGVGFSGARVVTAASNTTPITISVLRDNAFGTGAVRVAGVGGNTGANGNFTVGVNNSLTFTLAGSVGTGAYTSGGVVVNASGMVTAATNAAPIQITTSAVHGFASGQVIVVQGVGGNVAANGTWIITVVNSTNFTLNTSDGTASGAYTATTGVAWWSYWFQTNVLWDQPTANALSSFIPYYLSSALIAENLAKQTTPFYGASSAAIAAKARTFIDYYRANVRDTYAGTTFSDLDEWASVVPDPWNSGNVLIPPDGVPTGLFLTALGPTEATGLFTDHATNEESFEVQIKLSTETNYHVALTPLASAGTGGVVMFLLTGLIPEKVYNVRVAAKNVVGYSAFSTVANVTTPAQGGGGGPTPFPVTFIPPNRNTGRVGLFFGGPGVVADFFEFYDYFAEVVRNIDAGRSLSELRDDLKRLVDRSNSTNQKNDMLNQFLRDAHEQLMIELGDLALFARVEEHLTLSSNADWSISLPRQVERVESVWSLVLNQPETFRYRDMTPDGILSIQINGHYSGVTKTYRVVYFRKPPELLDDTDQTFVPRRIDEALVVGAARRVAEHDSDATFNAAMTARWGELIGMAKKYYSRLYRQSFSRMTVQPVYRSPMRFST